MNQSIHQSASPCICCGGTKFSAYARKRGWQLMRCANCTLIAVHPQPTDEELRSLYSFSSGYYVSADTDLSHSRNSDIPALEALLKRHLPPGNRLLDVGCANGRVIWHLRRRGWQVAGTEINQGALTIARTNGLDVHEGPLESAPLAAGTFDVIRFHHVLEHTTNPRRNLEKAREILAPGGLRLISVPNADEMFARLTRGFFGRLGADWPHSEAPYHLFEFNPRSLTLLLEGLGYHVMEMLSSGRRPFAYTVGASGHFDELKKMLKRKSKRQILPHIARNLPKLLIVTLSLMPFFAMSQISNRLHRVGCNLTCVARCI